MTYTNQEKKAVSNHPSDDSERLVAEVQATTREKASKLLNEPLGAGYTVDNEGNFNNYAIEPKTYKAEYPSPKQQRRYIFQGIAAILFVALVLWVAFSAS